MQTVQPWATAATLAQADPDNPHGVLLAPYLAPAVDGSGEVEGFVVAAVFDTNSSEMQVGRSARLFSESPCCRCTLQARWRAACGLDTQPPPQSTLKAYTAPRCGPSRLKATLARTVARQSRIPSQRPPATTHPPPSAVGSAWRLLKW